MNSNYPDRSNESKPATAQQASSEDGTENTEMAMQDLIRVESMADQLEAKLDAFLDDLETLLSTT